MSSQNLGRALKLISRSRSIVALTGAGISTASGIPDFRSRGSGLWEQYNPLEVATLTAFRYQPQFFYSWFRELAIKIWNAKPNAAHFALSALEKANLLKGVITQNIDGLQQAAGSHRVFELHGHLREAVCMCCHQSYKNTDFFQQFVEQGAVPMCERCGAVLKPKIILMGEQLPFRIVQKARELLSTCDLILVVGSSLEVVPAATLPLIALDSGARLILVNLTPTYLDQRADVVFHEDSTAVLPKLVSEVVGEF
jgi:NAD-dependent deacetylase